MLVLIHGWSDETKSFRRLSEYLEEGNGGVVNLYLGDYISMDDEVTFDDLRAAMETAWNASGLPTDPRSVDVVVHSTGALVVRHWMTNHYTPDTNPVRRFVMLAPANFGSPLAHKGRSFIGRVIKGYKSTKRFQTGTHILKGLELGSPFSYELAFRDRFGSKTWYGPGKVLATVIVGTDGYSGIAAAANEVGSDGTVRVSTANLNPLNITMDFSTDPLHPTFSLKKPKGKTAFFRVDGLNHSTVALKGRDVAASNELRKLISRALSVDDSNFDEFCRDSESYSASVRSTQREHTYTQAFQNTVIYISDNFDTDVEDYFIELFAKRASKSRATDVDERLTRRLQEKVVANVHAYRDNPSFRSLHCNVTALHELLVEEKQNLYVAVTAMPDLSTNSVVGYKTLGYNDIGSIRLSPDEISKLFGEDRTVLLSLKLKREQDPEVFEFRRN